MMSHTKEPWRIGRFAGPASYKVVRETVGATDIVVDTETGVYVLAQCNNNFPEDAKANALRIVACVNACAGMSQQYIEELNGETLADRIMVLMTQRDEYSLLAYRRQNILDEVIKQRDELLAALEDAMIMIWRIKKHCQITDNAGYTLDGRMLKLTDVEQSSSAAIANTRKAMGKCYYAPDGTLMNSDGTRSIFDDVDQ